MILNFLWLYATTFISLKSREMSAEVSLIAASTGETRSIVMDETATAPTKEFPRPKTGTASEKSPSLDSSTVMA